MNLARQAKKQKQDDKDSSIDKTEVRKLLVGQSNDTISVKIAVTAILVVTAVERTRGRGVKQQEL